MPRLLLVDDDGALLDALRPVFEEAGHQVTLAHDGREALARLAEGAFDVVVSDVNMPRSDGFVLCRTLRAAGNLVPFVLLTSHDEEIEQALGLELGADDYVPKPFSTRVLLGRVGALLRREQMRAGEGEGEQTTVPMPMQRGALVLDPERLEVHFRGEPIAVTISEFRMLESLARRPGVVYSRDRLLEIMRGEGPVADSRIVDTYARRLRRKLERVDAAFNRIDGVVGSGYRWKADEDA